MAAGVARLVECVYCHERFSMRIHPHPACNLRVTVDNLSRYWLAWQCPNHRDDPEHDHGWQHDRDQLGCFQVGYLVGADRGLFDRFENVDPRACSRTVPMNWPAIDEDDLIEAAKICQGPNRDRWNTPLFDDAIAILNRDAAS